MKLKLLVRLCCASSLAVFTSAVLAQEPVSQTSNRVDVAQTSTHPSNYKDELPPAVPQCMVSQNALILNHTTQNTNRALPNPCSNLWWKYVGFNAGLNFDVGKLGPDANFQGENYQHFSVNDAYVNVAANFADWAQAFTSFSFNSATIHENPDRHHRFGAAEYSATYSNNINNGSNHNPQVEQAFARIGNLDVFPLYVEAGKEFQDFSRYQLHPITYSLTQVLSEVLATSVKLGFIEQGFYGSVYGFDNAIHSASSDSNHNYGVAFGYEAPDPDIGWAIGASYLYNLIGANNVAYQVVNFTTGGGTRSDDGFYHRRVGAIAVYGDVNAGPFTLDVRYTQALQSFSVFDLPANGVADLSNNHIAGLPLQNSSGAKPWAAGFDAGYHYLLWDLNQQLFVGYQTSRQTAGLDLPKHRILAGYGIEVVKNINLTAEWDYDRAFNRSHGGTGADTSLFSIRADLRLV